MGCQISARGRLVSPAVNGIMRRCKACSRNPTPAPIYPGVSFPGAVPDPASSHPAPSHKRPPLTRPLKRGQSVGA